MRIKQLFLLLAVLLFVAYGVRAQGLDSSGLCTRCKPCEDFYKFVNQVYLDHHPIPPDRSSWGPWSEVSEHNLVVLHEILDSASKAARSGAAPKGSNLQRIGDFYSSALDSITIEHRGLDPLKPEFARIDAIHNPQGLIDEIANLQSLHLGSPFAVGVDQDAKNSQRMMLTVWQSGLGLPDRDYYFRPDKRSKALRSAYLKHVAKMLELSGVRSDIALKQAKSIFDFETVLAQASMTRVERRNPDSTYHDLSLSALGALTPSLSWSAYLADIGASNTNDVNIGQPKFMRAVDSLLVHAPLETWKAYLKWQLLDAMSPALSHAFVDEGFEFEKLLYGSSEQQARWKRSIRSVDRNIGEALGQEYVKVAFPPEAKQRMMAMIQNLKEALRSDLTSLTWIGDTTRRRAIEKLDAFQQKIGYPDKWRDYSSLTIGPGKYLENIEAARRFEFRRQLNKLNKPLERTEFGMSPPTINAYYDASMNEIVFPAGILQPPFFDFARDEAYNYGAIGTVIGHEMTHGFDDDGAKYDARGNLENWWSPSDLKNFQDRAKCIIDQFSSYAVQDSIHLTGGQVVGESIADLGGVALGYAALERYLQNHPRTIIDGFTPEQRFFLGYARQWATNVRPEAERTQVYTDSHPPAYFRVIGPLSNFPPFAQAFNCKEGDRMVRPASERCSIW